MKTIPPRSSLLHYRLLHSTCAQHAKSKEIRRQYKQEQHEIRDMDYQSRIFGNHYLRGAVPLLPRKMREIEPKLRVGDYVRVVPPFYGRLGPAQKDKLMAEAERLDHESLAEYSKSSTYLNPKSSTAETSFMPPIWGRENLWWRKRKISKIDHKRGLVELQNTYDFAAQWIKKDMSYTQRSDLEDITLNRAFKRNKEQHKGVKQYLGIEENQERKLTLKEHYALDLKPELVDEVNEVNFYDTVNQQAAESPCPVSIDDVQLYIGDLPSNGALSSKRSTYATALVMTPRIIATGTEGRVDRFAAAVEPNDRIWDPRVNIAWPKEASDLNERDEESKHDEKEARLTDEAKEQQKLYGQDAQLSLDRSNIPHQANRAISEGQRVHLLHDPVKSNHLRPVEVNKQDDKKEIQDNSGRAITNEVRIHARRDQWLPSDVSQSSMGSDAGLAMQEHLKNVHNAYLNLSVSSDDNLGMELYMDAETQNIFTKKTRTAKFFAKKRETALEQQRRRDMAVKHAQYVSLEGDRPLLPTIRSIHDESDLLFKHDLSARRQLNRAQFYMRRVFCPERTVTLPVLDRLGNVVLLESGKPELEEVILPAGYYPRKMLEDEQKWRDAVAKQEFKENWIAIGQHVRRMTKEELANYDQTMKDQIDAFNEVPSDELKASQAQAI